MIQYFKRTCLRLYTRVPTHLENLENSLKFVNLENCWIFFFQKSGNPVYGHNLICDVPSVF